MKYKRIRRNVRANVRHQKFQASSYNKWCSCDLELCIVMLLEDYILFFEETCVSLSLYKLLNTYTSVELALPSSFY